MTTMTPTDCGKHVRAQIEERRAAIEAECYAIGDRRSANPLTFVMGRPVPAGEKAQYDADMARVLELTREEKRLEAAQHSAELRSIQGMATESATVWLIARQSQLLFERVDAADEREKVEARAYEIAGSTMTDAEGNEYRDCKKRAATLTSEIALLAHGRAVIDVLLASLPAAAAR